MHRQTFVALDDIARIFDNDAMNASSEATVLLVEDDDTIRQLVADLLTREGFRVETAGDGAALDALLGRVQPDLFILDLMLPREDGLSICRRLRPLFVAPILILSAKSDEIDRVLGLELGADDYLVKPFGSRELLARVRALLRRARAPVAQMPARRFAFDRFVIDLDARQLIDRDAQPIVLTTAEFDLLACFVQHPRRVLSRDQILDSTHGRAAEPFDRTVDMLTSRLRRKLEAASPGSNLISTARNRGYLFTVPVSPAA
jgi:DNA-binding response OmpR family regulator